MPCLVNDISVILYSETDLFSGLSPCHFLRIYHSALSLIPVETLPVCRGKISWQGGYVTVTFRDASVKPPHNHTQSLQDSTLVNVQVPLSKPDRTLC